MSRRLTSVASRRSARRSVFWEHGAPMGKLKWLLGLLAVAALGLWSASTTLAVSADNDAAGVALDADDHDEGDKEHEHLLADEDKHEEEHADKEHALTADDEKHEEEHADKDHAL